MENSFLSLISPSSSPLEARIFLSLREKIEARERKLYKEMEFQAWNQVFESLKSSENASKRYYVPVLDTLSMAEILHVL
ncbi:hypothetical protein V6Z11_A08G073100 [Gossypium hirsutum]